MDDHEPIPNVLNSVKASHARNCRMAAADLVREWDKDFNKWSYQSLREFCGVPDLTDSQWTDCNNFTYGHLKKLELLLGPNGYTIWRAWKVQQDRQ